MSVKADRVIGCDDCGKPVVLVGDEVPLVTICPWCRAVDAPGAYQLFINSHVTTATTALEQRIMALELDLQRQREHHKRSTAHLEQERDVARLAIDGLYATYQALVQARDDNSSYIVRLRDRIWHLEAVLRDSIERLKDAALLDVRDVVQLLQGELNVVVPSTDTSRDTKSSKGA